MKIVKIKTKYKTYNYRPKIPIKNINWEFRKGDDDYRPSVPHGHSLEGKKADGKYKLELWTGNIYEESTGKLYGVAKKKDMVLLYKDIEFKKFVDECRKIYQQKNPKFKLPPLKNNGMIRMNTYMNKRLVRSIGSNQNRDTHRFVISLEYTEIKK